MALETFVAHVGTVVIGKQTLMVTCASSDVKAPIAEVCGGAMALVTPKRRLTP